MARYGTVRHGTVRFGKAWYGTLQSITLNAVEVQDAKKPVHPAALMPPPSSHTAPRHPL